MENTNVLLDLVMDFDNGEEACLSPLVFRTVIYSYPDHDMYAYKPAIILK